MIERYFKLFETKIQIPNKEIDLSMYSSFYSDVFKDWVDSVSGYLSGKYKFIGYYTKGKYSCGILNNTQNFKLSFRKDLYQLPVPIGKWMRWYEKNWKQDYKISVGQWEKLSTEEKAILECKEQLDKWIPFQYENNFIRFYFPEEYSKWQELSISKPIHELFTKLVK
jgi:hypothetical protein